MSWELVYLTCFGLGFTLSVLSFLTGVLHLHLPVHGRVHAGLRFTVHHGSASPLNGFTLMAFLCWFGGTGYLLTRYSALVAVLTLLCAVGGGLAGAAAVFWFLVKALLAHDRPMEEGEGGMVGVLGRVSVPIRAEGTGEILFSQDGVRRCAGARSETGAPLAKGVEVVVMRYERGIAYVRPWDELAGGTMAGEAFREL